MVSAQPKVVPHIMIIAEQSEHATTSFEIPYRKRHFQRDTLPDYLNPPLHHRVRYTSQKSFDEIAMPKYTQKHQYR